MDDNFPKLKRPVALEASTSREAETIITGVQMSFGGLVRFFVKAWFAWLIATLIIFLLLGIPILIVLMVLTKGGISN